MKARPYTIQIMDQEKADLLGVGRFVYEPHVEFRVGDVIRTKQNGWKLFMIVAGTSHDAEADPDRPIATQEEKTDDQRRARCGPFQAKTPGAWANGYVVLTEQEEDDKHFWPSVPGMHVSAIVRDAEGTDVEKHVIPVRPETQRYGNKERGKQ